MCLYGDYGVTVNTEVCGTFNLGSIPSSPPEKKTLAGLFWGLRKIWDIFRLGSEKLFECMRNFNFKYTEKVYSPCKGRFPHYSPLTQLVPIGFLVTTILAPVESIQYPASPIGK
jgi:hypothetical protein